MEDFVNSNRNQATEEIKSTVNEDKNDDNDDLIFRFERFGASETVRRKA